MASSTVMTVSMLLYRVAVGNYLDKYNNRWSLEEDATTATKIKTFLEIMVYII